MSLAGWWAGMLSASKVVVVGLHFGAVRDEEPHAREDVLELVLHLAERTEVPAYLWGPLFGDVDPLLIGQAVERPGLQSLAPLLHRGLNPRLGVVDRLAQNGALLRRRLLERLHRALESRLPAQVRYPSRLQGGRFRGAGDGRQGLLLQLGYLLGRHVCSRRAMASIST